MTFEEWRQSDDAWAWPAGKGEPDLDTMLRRAWDAGERCGADAMYEEVKAYLKRRLKEEEEFDEWIAYVRSRGFLL